MGDETTEEHEAVIRKALETDVDEVIFVGGEFFEVSPKVRKSESPKAVFYSTVEQAIAALRDEPIKDSTVLIKGSRGMALERLVELF